MENKKITSALISVFDKKNWIKMFCMLVRGDVVRMTPPDRRAHPRYLGVARAELPRRGRAARGRGQARHDRDVAAAAQVARRPGGGW